jgi:polyhydroxyalkanoate synthesis regulator phasin
MADLIERVFLLGIGAASLTKEKVDDLVDELVKRGQMTREEGQKLVEKASGAAREEGANVSGKFSEAYQDALRGMGIATREHIDELERRIAVLEANVYGKPSRVEEPGTGFVATQTEEVEPR